MESFPFKPARANQGLARPAVPTARRAAGLLLAPAWRLWRWGGEPATSVTGSNTAASGCRRSPPCPQRGPMERSLHRVSLGSRRAHRDLSFYLTTFGKCFWDGLPGLLPLLPSPRKASSRGERRGGNRLLLLRGHLLRPLSPEIAQDGAGHRSGRVATHHLLPAAALAGCSWFCLTWLE